MSKFDWVLSQEEKDKIVNSAHDRHGEPCLYELADRVEQAVLTKLAEQDHVATVSYLMGGIDLKVADGRRLPKGMRLYAAPVPAIEQKPSAWFIDDKRVCGNRIITDPEIAGDWLETDPDKVTPLYAHPSPSNVSDKTACVPGSAECDKQDHIPAAGQVIPDGWEPIETVESGVGMPITVLVLTSINSVYTAYSMGGEIALITPFDGLSSDYKAHGEPRYWMPLPTAPKNEEVKKESPNDKAQKKSV